MVDAGLHWEITIVGFGYYMFQIIFMTLQCEVLLWVRMHHPSNQSTQPDLFCVL